MMRSIRWLLIGLFAAMALGTLEVQAQTEKKAATGKKAERKVQPAYVEVEDVPGLPRVLLLGDSISIGYTLEVRKDLAGKANVHRPADNCGPTSKGLENLAAWLGEGRWDVIHFNFGLHDLKFVDEKGQNTSPEKGKHQVSLEQYEENLASLVEVLKKTGASLIFGTTTPVPPGEPQRKQGDELAYNEAAVRVMKAHGVTVNDLHGFIAADFEKVATATGNVHFSAEGSAKLAGQVARAIEEALAKRK